MKRTGILFAAVLIFFFAGCENGQEGAAVVDEIEVLRGANDPLSA